jgi:hypothetical protein
MSQENEIEAEKLSLTKDFLPSDGAYCSGFFIVNRYDRPSEDYIAERRKDGFLYYVHPKLRNEKRYWAMNPSDPTPLEDFGIRILIEDGELHGKLVDPSRATYLDGRARKWQGEDEFSFYYPNEAMASGENRREKAIFQRD